MDKSVFRPIQSQPIKSQQNRLPKVNHSKNNTFSLHLQQAIETNSKLTISKHAKERLHQRGITISESRWENIQEKVNEAKKMGVKDSLVLLDNAALIISAKNNTVITAMDRNEATSQIFTNINGTIVLE
ncbi:TIGR02530 family flagellar biosynthesis protein [Cytobacillus sp. FJAT-54145]|uniref:TIGR02530 family flagellar biosynthesis protein n=1 Tax=Cytobacillus spartinae TaxID=3299023 RepID=A0ABW6K727_9BACI